MPGCRPQEGGLDEDGFTALDEGCFVNGRRFRRS